MKCLVSTIVALALSTAPARGAELTDAAAAAWDRYVKSTEARRGRERPDSGRFLASDFEPNGAAVRAALMRGDLVIEEVELGRAERDAVPDSTVHHWRGAVLVRGVTLAGLVDALRNPHRHGYAPPDVLQWRVLHRQGDRERVFLRLRRQEIVTAVFNTEHDVQFTWHDTNRASSRSVATRIAEVTDAGEARASEKPIGRDRGFLWRMNSYWRYEAVPGGVLVELESLTLSRDVPALLRPLARPIITRVARESIQQTLGSIRDQLGRRRDGAEPTRGVIESAKMRALLGRSTSDTCTPISNI
jgi:hypothetical protein